MPAPSAGSREPYRVFISHATYDKFLAKTLCDKIEALSVPVATFRDDRDISGGDRISAAIMEAIRGCQEVIMVLTPKSIARQWVLVEIGMAEFAQKRIVPLFYHVAPDDIPEILRPRRGFHLEELDEYLKDLEARVREQNQ